METISLWQPHATLIMLGAKPFETRSWPAPKRLIGKRVRIHAAKCLDDLRELVDYIDWRNEGGDIYLAFEAMREVLVQAGIEKIGDLPRGCVLGSAVLRASHPTETLCHSGHFGNFGPGRHAWRMVDPIVLPEPLPYRGQQGFFRVPDDLFAGHALGALPASTIVDHSSWKRCRQPGQH